MRRRFQLISFSIETDGEKNAKKMGFNSALLLSSLLISLSSLSLPSPSDATDTLSLGQSINDGETLVSAGEIFELGFFSPGRSKHRYVGIWYYNFSTNTVLWVANREVPVPDTTGALTIGNDGNLAVLHPTNGIVWSSNVSVVSSNISTVQLTDSGNLVLNISGNIAWQSFDHPTDTYLPGMKVGLNLRTNVNQRFTSWKSEDDPAVGNFSMGIDPRRSTQLFIWEGAKPRWRSGRWNGQVFIGIPNMVPQYIYGFKLSNFEQEQLMYFYYSALNSSHRYVLTWEGVEKHLIWKDDAKNWSLYWAAPTSVCDLYNNCGNYGSCTDGSTPNCRCLKGFVPVSDNEWNGGDWSSGCVRRTRLQCETNSTSGEADGFLRMEGVKLPDLSDWKPDVPNDSNCLATCLGNCSCRAYSYVTGIGCLIWGVDLVDVHIFSSGGSDMYLRLAGSEFDDQKGISTVVIVIIVSASFILLASIYLLWKRKRRIKEFLKQLKGRGVASMAPSGGEEGTADLSVTNEIKRERNDGEGHELRLWSFDSILASTGNFSYTNLLGKGGFGPVYKGVLPGGQEIAVKRLSRSSGQGLEEFKNEVILIAKLQHRNLVRMLGYCIHGEEKILIYEYMPNRSLDKFLFDSTKKGLLDWKTRYNIIEGIARGLLYLHRDSRLRVIHRDLKASNILLDEEMNPKISDFGMARIFGTDDNETNTKRVAGTYGYMSPEYALQGLSSVKSDVYSFGVLLLEIFSGKKNSTYHHPDLPLNLLAYAWKLWNEDNTMELVDPSIRESCSQREVSRCINIGLLCVQDRANDRPTMSSVVIMLESGITAQPVPKPPTFTSERSETDSSTDHRVDSATTSITKLIGR